MQITAVAVFIKDGKVLLEKRRKNEDNYAGFWALPGGHKRKSESIKQTLKREMSEELNLHIKKAKYIGMFRDIDPTSKDIFHHHAFLCEEWRNHITYTREEERIKWWDLKKFKKIPNHRKVDEKILKQLKLI